MSDTGFIAGQSEAGVSGAIALRIYDAMQEMVNTRGTRIPSRLDPLIQRALHVSGPSDPNARARLERMSVQLDYLRAAQRARMADEVRTCTANLTRLTTQWLDQTQVC
jgi:hypothetical protein